VKPDPIAECAQCGKPFIRRTTLQTYCRPRCLFKARAEQEKAERADFKRRKEAAKPRSKWLQEAQSAFNAWIRARDSALGCISCGTRDGKVNAGHYLSTGARPELRFDEANVHRQCERCNTYLSGNLVLYRANLIERIGLAEVERLEGPHPPRKYTSDDLRAIRDTYRAKAREMARYANE
jgi:hypothetical protein